MGTRGRVVLVTMAVVVAAGTLAATLAPAPWERARPVTSPVPPAGPGSVAPDPVELAIDPADAALRDRLGGLGALVIGEDPELRECADPGSLPPPAELTGTGQVDQVTAEVERLRGLVLTGPPEIRLLTDAEMDSQVARAFGDQWDERRIDLDARSLTALGAIAPGTDLGRLRVARFAGQVSGFHLGGEQVIGIRTRDPDTLSPLERVVLAHELEHALSYTHLGRPGDDRDGDQTGDASLASAAVVEGSATATMLQYATTGLDPADRATLREQLAARAGGQGLAGYSPYLRAELRFPYVAGLRYICQRWLAGGWEAVAGAYRDPPATTAAVLFPERHGERPRQPAPLGEPGGGWERARTASFGAAELEWLLAAPGGNPNAALDRPRERVAAWAGGELAVWTGEAGTAVGLSFVDRGGAAPLCGTLRQWYQAAFPMAGLTGDTTTSTFTAGRQDAVLTCRGDRVRLGIGPTTADAARIAGGASPEG